jgi:hypothetical protein
MKPTFIAVVLVGLSAASCVAYELPPPATSGDDTEGEGEGEGDGDGDDSGDGDGDPGGPGCDAGGCEDPEDVHDLSGELILFVNARLSDESAAFQAHLPLDEAGTYIGNALYLYVPTRECDDGGNACRMAMLGHLRLDESLGEISGADNSLRKFVVRDLAWHPERGLWSATFDPLNDEWSISALEVDDWARTDNLIGVQRWVIPPGPAESPSTDPCYWFESVSGLGFAGDEMLLGVRGAGSKGLIADGSLLRVDMNVLEQGHCVHSSDISQDPLYYACDVMCEQSCSFGSKIGVAGDVIEDDEQLGASAWLRSEDDAVMPLGRNEMSTCAPSEPGDVVDAVPDNVFIEDVVRGDEIDGLARVGGKLYGLSVLGKVYEIDEAERIVTQIDDLGPLFPEQGLRLRGATEIVVPSP